MLGPKVFRAYDIRGVADVDFRSDDIRQLGQAFGSMLVSKGGRSVAIGRDCRTSGERLFEAFAEGAQAADNATNQGESLHVRSLSSRRVWCQACQMTAR